MHLKVRNVGRLNPARRSNVLITVRAREDNEDLSVSNSSSFEPSATLKALSGNRPSSRVSSYAEGILPTLGLLRAVVLLPPTIEGSPRRKRTLKPGKGLMSPSAVVHCDAREDRARVAPRDASLSRVAAAAHCVRNSYAVAS